MVEQNAIFPLESIPGSGGHEVAAEGSNELLAPAGAPASERVRPTPHKSKLQELLANDKLPREDSARVATAVVRYDQWIADMEALATVGTDKVRDLVSLLNEYKRAIEIDLVWDSDHDFLFRQRGQLKVDNSVLEEFLPWLVDPEIIPALKNMDCFAGPASAFAAAYFQTAITAPLHSLGLRIRTKDQDFTLSRRAFVRASFDKNFPADATDNEAVWLAYLAAECKTNLDKTMFQSAIADAHDLKVAMPGSRYYIICEYLDMTPISTAGTDVDEVLVLRGKRLASNKRARYSTANGRRAHRDEYLDLLNRSPVRLSVVERFVEHLEGLINHSDPEEDDVVSRGYF
ncbi:Bpu10I family restriction endonuclease [Crossiella sp. CA198]|uniref:Bpu10I family restriction endonuclease n=1 Tax=Crossiella sp. CA198 TaxID=3455607 RepID=UPI003F8D46BE